MIVMSCGGSRPHVHPSFGAEESRCRVFCGTGGGLNKSLFLTSSNTPSTSDLVPALAALHTGKNRPTHSIVDVDPDFCHDKLGLYRREVHGESDSRLLLLLERANELLRTSSTKRCGVGLSKDLRLDQYNINDSGTYC